MSEYQKCPFCGGSGKLFWYTAGSVIDDEDGDNRYFVYCEKCDAQTGEYKSAGEAIIAWNKRNIMENNNQIKPSGPLIQPLSEVINALKVCDDDHYVCTDCAYYNGNKCSRRMAVDSVYYLEILERILQDMKFFVEKVGDTK